MWAFTIFPYWMLHACVVLDNSIFRRIDELSLSDEVLKHNHFTLFIQCIITHCTTWGWDFTLMLVFSLTHAHEISPHIACRLTQKVFFDACKMFLPPFVASYIRTVFLSWKLHQYPCEFIFTVPLFTELGTFDGVLLTWGRVYKPMQCMCVCVAQGASVILQNGSSKTVTY